MKKRYFLLFFLLPFHTLIGQETTKITSAGGVSIAEAFLIRDIVSVKEHGFLVFQSYILNGVTELEFQIYDLTRTLTNTKTFRFDENKEEPFVQGYTEWNNHFLLFVSYYKESTSTNELYVYQYTLPDLQLKLSAKVMEAYSPVDLNIPFFYNTSPNESKLAIAAWSYTIPKDPGNIEVKVLNEDLKITKEYKYLMPYENLKNHVKESIIDDEGNVYLIGKKHNGSTSLSYDELGNLAGVPYVLAFYDLQKEPNLFEIEVKKYRFPSIKFNLNPQQELMGVGFYKEGGRKNFSGICTITINKEEKSLLFNEAEVDKELLLEALGENPPKVQNSSGFRYARIEDLILKDNGYYLVGEQIHYNVDKSLTSNNIYGNIYSTYVPYNNVRYTLDYSLLDMFVIRLDKKGKIRWMTRIPKLQELDNKLTNYLSFSVMERERDLLLFYNDHPDNFSFKPKDKVKKLELRSAQPMLAKINCNNGQVKKRKLTSLFGKNTIIRPSFCKILDEQRVFMYGQKKKWDLKTYRMKIALLGD